MSGLANVLLGGIFHAAVLFLVAAGLQLVFGVQKIVNLACGSFYALGAYFGITLVNLALNAACRPGRCCRCCIVAGVLMAAVGPPIERLLRTVYDRDESFQLLLTFALVLMFQDVLRFVWGANPQSLSNVLMVYGKVSWGDFSVPVYNLLVIAAAIAAAFLIGLFLQRTNYGRLLRATAENRSMAEALGVDVRSVYAVVFTLGTLLGTIGGALVVPTSAASLDMAIEFVIEAFAVVVIGGLGSMSGALVGALLVGLIRAVSLVIYPEFEILAIYLIVIARAAVQAFRAVRKAGDVMRGATLILVAAGVVALGLVPVLAPPFYANLLIPFFGYAIALLGFNLLFGYTGLLSFGHAMFLGLGAYGAAVIAGVLGIRHFEMVLVGVALAPSWWRCRSGFCACATPAYSSAC